ncbi:hypothetical protein [Mesorhizobium sp. M0047]
MLKTTGNFRGCRRNCICRFMSSRPQVGAKEKAKRDDTGIESWRA